MDASHPAPPESASSDEPVDDVLARLARRDDAPSLDDRESLLRWAAEADADFDGPVPLSRYLVELRAQRPDLLDAYPQIPGIDVAEYREWARVFGREQVPLPAAVVPEAAEDPPVAYAQPGVNLAGFLTAELGVGELARRLALALRAGSVPYATTTFSRTANRTGIEFGPDTDARFDTNVVCVNADSWGRFAQRVGPSFFAGRTTIGVWFWETTIFPSMFHSAFRGVDELWAASDHVADALRAAAPPELPIWVFDVPIVVPPVSTNDVRALVGLDPHRPYVLTSFDHHSVPERKNPFGAIRAFRAAFADGDGPQLIVKSINGDRHPEDMQRLRDAADGRTDIVLHDGYLDAADNNALLANAAALVSLHRAEGYGFNIADAIASGVPVIATAYSGNLAFVDDDCYLVPATEVPVGPGHFPYEPDAVWAEPDLDVAVAHLRAIAAEPDVARERAARAQRAALARFTPEHTGAQIRNRVAALRARRAAAAAAVTPPPEPAPPSRQARLLTRLRAEPARVAALRPRAASTVVCAIGAGPHAALLDLARPPLEAWADRFGYDLDLRTELLAPERAASWSKVLLVRERLETHRVVIWVDADTVVFDGREDASKLVTRRMPLAMTAHTYAGQSVPNLGVFVMRSTRRTKKLLDQLWSMTQYLDHKWWENAALLDLLGYDIEQEPIRKVRPSELDDHITWLSNEWNSISLDEAARPIIKHYPGQTNDDRSRLMAADVEAWRARQSPTS